MFEFGFSSHEAQRFEYDAYRILFDKFSLISL
jgi:hypothetical protein